MSDSLRPHEAQHTRPPCPSPTPRVYPNPCPLSRWCHPNISSCRLLLLLPSIFPSIRVFSNESALHIGRWPKYWSFSFNTLLVLCNSQSPFLCIAVSSQTNQPNSLVIEWKKLKLGWKNKCGYTTSNFAQLLKKQSFSVNVFSVLSLTQKWVSKI